MSDYFGDRSREETSRLWEALLSSTPISRRNRAALPEPCNPTLACLFTTALLSYNIDAIYPLLILATLDWNNLFLPLLPDCWLSPWLHVELLWGTLKNTAT